ncbi:MAG: substrate-binding domain-containing protein [Oscillospiraceae bacterium]|nr:substrate-binding domain-containing protein [Oscillospiraceae bacterium]
MCAEQLLAQENGLPDAVACANDQMAIGLCKAFAEHGIRVPEDIAVVGYDSTYEGRTSPKSVTSAMIPAEEFGEYAFHFLMTHMKGETPESFLIQPHLVFGESCGCQRISSLHQQGMGICKGKHPAAEQQPSAADAPCDPLL